MCLADDDRMADDDAPAPPRGVPWRHAPFTRPAARRHTKQQHDKLGIVRMIMYYKDTADLVVDRRRQLLSFHVFNPLENFADHYDHRVGVCLRSACRHPPSLALLC